MLRRRTSAFCVLALTAALLIPLPALAAPPGVGDPPDADAQIVGGRDPGSEPAGGDDTIEVGSSIEQYLIDQRLEGEAASALKDITAQALDQARELGERSAREALRQRGRERGPTIDLPDADPYPDPARDYTADPLVGQVKTWLSLDNVAGQYYFKEYRLAAVGDHIEVWVALEESGGYDADAGVYRLPFPEGDCRNTTYDGARVEVTDAQVNQLVADFDLNIHPLETEYFRTPPPRSGEEALLPGLVGLPDDYYATEGGADRTVTLIDNVRDSNYFTPPDVEPLSYIAGFFSPTFNLYYDRNTMTVDSWDWLHRTGPNPPDDGSEDPCLNAPSNPFLYEGTFAHEWQHLLQSYTGEVTWLNEGLSDWAQTLTGYVDPATPITDPEYDSHIQCFYGYLAEQTSANLIPKEDAGPENSLTWWEDQGFDEILCDYGAAYTMLEYLVGQFGLDAATYLHLDEATGLTSVADLLAAEGADRDVRTLLDDWAAMVALDGAIDGRRGILLGDVPAARLQAPTLDASVRWEGDDAYDTPGAPPNGSDYVRLRSGAGDPLGSRDITSLTFTGATEYPTTPVEWTIDDPGGAAASDDALYSGSGNNLDRTMAFATTVPSDDPTLTFETRFDIEWEWDFGFVQVSSDGGETWQSLANDLTTTQVNPDAIPTVQENLPGFTGSSQLDDDGNPVLSPAQGDPTWVTTSFDLSAYAGQEILVGFRYVTDPAVVNAGWWVDDIAVGGTVVNDGTSLEGLRSYNEIRPDGVAAWTVQLVSLDPDGRRPTTISRYEVEPGETLELSRIDLRRSLRGNNSLVGAIVTLHEPTESVLQYAPYRLTVNGVDQPGGGDL